MIPWLNPEIIDFPPTQSALSDPNGLLAVGGDLSVVRLLEAYRRGIFPWYDASQPILWWTPNPRMILQLDDFHISRSLRKILRQRRFCVTADTAFREVIQACAEPRQDQGTWITSAMQEAYQRLHEENWAHSIEVWLDDKLAGGLYGIAMDRVFFGESMFAKESNASKVACAHLVERLKLWGYGVIDCQVSSHHLASMGAQEISRRDFERLLQRYIHDLSAPSSWSQPWCEATFD